MSLVVEVHGIKHSWTFLCQGCNRSQNFKGTDAKEQAGYAAYQHQMKCLAVYPLNERKRDAELGYEVERDRLLRQIEEIQGRKNSVNNARTLPLSQPV